MKERMMIEYFAVLAGVFVLTWLILRKLIPALKSKKIGQKIKDIGPRWHKGKEGTPIMGGLSFILATLAAFLVFAVVMICMGRAAELAAPAITLGMAVLNGCIGFFDDYTKLIKKQNKGLAGWQKFALQCVVAAIYLAVMTICGFVDTTLEIPFTDAELELGIFYYLITVLLIAGFANAVNLTDGIDGLASSVTAIVGAFYSVAVFAFAGASGEGQDGAAVLAAALVGGCLGFLMYNFYPAKIFMGDTGAIYLGGMVAGLAFLINEPLIICIAGIIYMLEVLSDFIQVSYFKLTHGKRFFKMAPIHHHFEQCGWSEIKIVCVFSAVTLAGCIIAWFGIR